MYAEQSRLIFLDDQSRARLSQWLKGIDRIRGLNPGRLGMLQLAGSDYISLHELALISDFMYPEPLSNIIMDADYHVRVEMRQKEVA